MQAEHQTIQVSKYPGAKFDPGAQPGGHDAVCRADPHVQPLRAPYMVSPRVPLRYLPGYPPGVDRACSMQDEGLDGLPDHLPMVTAHGTALRVPYMKRVKGSLRVVLSCIIVVYYCSSVILPQTYPPFRGPL